MEETLMSTGEVAKALGIPHYRLEYLISIGAISDTARRVAGKRAWSETEVQAARVVISAREKSKASS